MRRNQPFALYLSPPSDITGLLAIDRYAATGRIEFMYETGWRGEPALTIPVFIFADHVQIHISAFTASAFL